ncbi:MAG: MATE family efflux transporter [Ruminococcus sp.]|nr:MATE family efflux transporter [Ruminococcus sp.]
MKVALSDHFTLAKLLRFTLPTVAMMIFTSVYGVVDGFFVSNYVGKTPFTAVNFIMPFLMILGAVGFMFGAGGSALISKTMGEGDKEKANRLFSLFVYVTALCGAAIALLGIIFIPAVASLLGAEGELLENCVLYGRVILAALPFFMLQYEFQSFFAVSGKPQLGLAVTAASGFANIILDALFMAVLKLGLPGAASATAVSQAVGGIIPLIYFARPNSSLLRLLRPSETGFDGSSLLKACANGSSELMTNISMSLVNMLYNYQLIKYAGEDGVAAYGVLMYVNMIFLAVFIGYSVGTAPITGYNYGAGNRGELKSILKKSAAVTGILSVCMLLLAKALSGTLAGIFTGYDEALFGMTVRAFSLFSFSFLFAGVSIYGSSFFTALNNGLVSAFISFVRTFVFQTAAVLVLPPIFGIDGIWCSAAAAELLASAVTVFLIYKMRKKYGYV